MNILNIDLDFFLTRFTACAFSNSGKRLDDSSILPWKKNEVNHFLKTVLNLKVPNPGKFIKNHDEVFYEWRSLIEQKKLQVPFKLVHVDMHADLGFTGTETNCFKYFFDSFLRLDVAQRANPMTGKHGLNFGSYLLFAIGNRWISEIDFILRDDINVMDMLDSVLDDESFEKFCSLGENYIPGESFFIELMRNSNVVTPFDRPNNEFSNVEEREPKVKLNLVSKEQQIDRYKNIDWDFIFLCHSPNCTPVESDALIPLISQFIEQ